MNIDRDPSHPLRRAAGSPAAVRVVPSPDSARVGRRVGLLVGLLALVGAASGCAAAVRDVTQGSSPRIYQIKLSYSNVFLLRGGRGSIVIDAGSPGDLPAFKQRLQQIGATLSEIKLVVLTHGHGDHAGMGAALQRQGIKVAAGKADRPMTEAGRNDELKPTNVTARLIRRVVDLRYTPFTPDLLIDEAGIDLGAFGVPGRAVQMPGHTAGSVVVVLASGDKAFVGDMMLGGSLGGAIFPRTASEHYYQADPDQNHRNIHALLRRGIAVFYVGHGGPLARDSVIERFGLADTAQGSQGR